MGLTNEELTKYVRLFHGTVFRLAFSYVHERAEAEDVCQDAFLKLMSYRGRFETPENAKAWLIRVTINLSKNTLRSGRFTRRADADENLMSSDGEHRELYEAVLSLPPAYRAAIHLHYYEGYSVKEIARITGSSVTAVTSRLERARKKLKALLE
ncbi:MAG: sigma-70 family RNA polymerase sigma factor [Bacteroides sp.]|nr:sigma-70 family RNA polymerase sigma factor [Eubacterium sp.]MCM1417320.1 sigma-70 family RNA polymerase sigma factor [Roseburia sp.]MCM1461487.1 sigma-70 family RNA polymerase sigma factor [Bacteroides sp.]